MALWLVWEQVEAVAGNEGAYLWIYMTLAFATSALALVMYAMMNRLDSRPVVAFATALAIVSVPLAVMFLDQGRYAHFASLVLLAGVPLAIRSLYKRAMHQSSYAELFRFVRHNGIKVTRFWVDTLKQSQREPVWTIGGQTYSRIRYGEEAGAHAMSGPCRHCAAVPGQYHSLTCEAECCPKCRAQRFSCDCDCEADWVAQFDVQI